MALYFTSDDSNIRTGTIAKGQAQAFKIFPALRRNAMSPNHNYGFLFCRLLEVEGLATLIVTHFLNILFAQSFHHLFIMNQRTIGVDPTRSPLGFLTSDLNRSLNSPTKTGALGSNDFHI